MAKEACWHRGFRMTEDPRASLSRRTASGVAWTTVGNLATVGFQIVYTAVMARLLTPAEFGLVAMANVIIGLTSHMSRMGVGPALIQRPALTAQTTRTATSLAYSFGLGGAAIVVALSPAAGRFYNEPAVTAVAAVLAGSLALTGVSLTSEALLRRSLNFRRLVIIDLSSYVVGYLAVGIPTALAGAGVWSLVAATLSQALVRTTILLLSEPRGRRPGWERTEARSILRFGSQITGIGLTQYARMSLPTLLIGRTLGSAPLGQFNRAQLLINLPLEKVTSSVSRVLFPALASVNTERARFQAGYTLSVHIASTLVLVAVAFAIVLGDLLVSLILGPGWEEAAVVLPIIAAASGFAFLTHFAGVALEAFGRLRGMFAVELLVTISLLAALLAIGRSGLFAVASAILAVEASRFALFHWLLRSALGVSLAQTLLPMLPGLAVGVATAVIAFTADTVLSFHRPLPQLLLVVLCTVLALLPLLLLHPLFRRTISDLRFRLTASNSAGAGQQPDGSN
jgi:lipopolysaccharide exporter